MASRALDQGRGYGADEKRSANERATRYPRTPVKPKTATTRLKSSATKSKPTAKSAKGAGRSAQRKSLLPRIANQSGQTVLVVPLPPLPIMPIIITARIVGGVAGFGLRGLARLPRMGMRGLSATFFFGAMAYALIPSALGVLREAPGFVGDIFRGGAISSTFSPEVQRWSGEIGRWSGEYGLDPNLMATVMQIESCGHPTIASSAGAQGLFQVMPFHFALEESMTDPETNAKRGAGVLKECLRISNGNVRGALACYNGGPSLLSVPTDQWPDQTQRYVVWGEGIYADAKANADSATLDAWMNAGGAGLCNAARNTPK